MSVLLKGFAEARGDELALADDVGSLTFAELDERVNRMVHAMRAAGIEHGDTIAVVAGNCNEWFITMIACANTGVTFVPVNWHLVAPEIAYILGDSGSKAVVTDHRFVDTVRTALADPQSSGVGTAIVAGAPTDERFTNFDEFVDAGSPDDPDDQSFGGPMFYTSGTTGNPKGVRSGRCRRCPRRPPPRSGISSAPVSRS